jgi:plasmid stabilization system protein ParE
VAVRYHPAARAELRRAARWYERRRVGLGHALVDSVIDAEQRIRENPRSGAPFRENTRRMFVERFPYGLVYREEGSDILILAVAHLRRRPDYWRDRE